ALHARHAHHLPELDVVVPSHEVVGDLVVALLRIHLRPDSRYWLRIQSAKPASGPWRFSTRARPVPGFANPWRESRGAATNVSAPARTASSPTVNSTSPSRTQKASTWSSCWCGSTTKAGSKAISSAESCGT